MRPAAVAVIGGGVMGASVGLSPRRARPPRRAWSSTGPMAPAPAAPARATGGYRAQYGPRSMSGSRCSRGTSCAGSREETGVDPGYLPGGIPLAGGQRRRAGGARRRRRSAARRGAARGRGGRAGGHRRGSTPRSGWTASSAARSAPATASSGRSGFSTDISRPARGSGVRVEWDIEVTGIRRDARRPDRRGRDLARTGGSRRGRRCRGPLGRRRGRHGRPRRARDAASPPDRATAPCDLLPADMPMTIWAGDGFHLRVRDGRVLLLWPTPGVPDRPFDASGRPGLGGCRDGDGPRPGAGPPPAAVDRAACWAGLYEMSPDKHAILGARPGVPISTASTARRATG